MASDITALLEECLPGSEHRNTRAEILGKLSVSVGCRLGAEDNKDNSALLDVNFDLLDLCDDDDSVLCDLEDFSESNDKGDLALLQSRNKKIDEEQDKDMANADDGTERTTATSE